MGASSDGACGATSNHTHTHTQVRDAISGCHPSLHAPLAAAVTLAGGTSMLPGLATRLTKELIKAAPAAWAVGVHRGGRAHRSHRAWMGGALVASLPMLSELSVSRQVPTPSPLSSLARTRQSEELLQGARIELMTDRCFHLLRFAAAFGPSEAAAPL